MPIAECVVLTTRHVHCHLNMCGRSAMDCAAWAAGQQLDWDEGLERGEGFSHEAYTRQLAEDLGA